MSVTRTHYDARKKTFFVCLRFVVAALLVSNSAESLSGCRSLPRCNNKKRSTIIRNCFRSRSITKKFVEAIPLCDRTCCTCTMLV